MFYQCVTAAQIALDLGSPFCETPNLLYGFSSTGVAMTALIHSCGSVLRRGFCRLAAVVLVVGISGCASWNVPDGGFSESDLSESIRKARPQEKDVEYWSFSNKGRQIERDLHAL